MTREEQAAVKRAEAHARQILKQGADRAANDVIHGLKSLSGKGALAAQEMVSRGVPRGLAISAAAKVAGHQYMMTRLDPVGQDWAHLSPAAPQVTINRLKGEF